MKIFNLNKKFVSEIDVFLAEFDQKHPEKSSSQLREIAKFKKLAELRDHVSTKNADVLIDNDQFDI